MPSTLTHDDQSKYTHYTLSYRGAHTHRIILQSFRMCLGRSICLHSSGLMPTKYMSIICLPGHFSNAHVFCAPISFGLKNVLTAHHSNIKNALELKSKCI